MRAKIKEFGEISRFRQHLFPLLFLVVGTVIIYTSSLRGSFHFDDLQVKDRPNLHVSELSLDSLKSTFLWTPNSKKIYRPLPCLTLGLNYYFGKTDTFGYHLVNIAVHVLCAFAVYIFLHALLSIPGIRPDFAVKHRHEVAVVAAFLFAFHPIQTNVVSYVIQRMTSMAALFYIVSVTAYIFFRKETLSHESPSNIKKHSSLFIAIVSGLFAFSSKENAAFLPIMVFFIDRL